LGGDEELENKGLNMLNKAKNKNHIYGKTIQSIDTTCINMWVINFTDGSSIELFTETDGPLGIPTLNLENFIRGKSDE